MTQNPPQQLSARVPSKKPRFPIPRYPTGWFQIGFSSEFPAGEAKPLKVFGQDLVAFRNEQGVIKVLDAYCPHLGAHLGHGGVVGEDGCIKCPFHAWKFNGEGECTEVPYAKKIPPKAKLGAWHCRESGPFVWLWHDIDGKAPHWEMPHVPEFDPESDFSDIVVREWTIYSHNQEMAENAVDQAHFKYLHGTVNNPIGEVVFNDHIMHMNTPTVMTTPGGTVKGHVESMSYGFGMGLTRFTGLVETLLAGCVTPIDDDYVAVRFSFTVRKLGGADITKGVGAAFIKEISRQLEQDQPVWENKIHLDRPVLCDGDGPIAKFRKWCKTFFPEWYHKQAHDAYYGTK